MNRTRFFSHSFFAAGFGALLITVLSAALIDDALRQIFFAIAALVFAVIAVSASIWANRKPTLVEQVSPYMVKLADILQMAAQSDDPQVVIRKVATAINEAAGRTLIKVDHLR